MTCPTCIRQAEFGRSSLSDPIHCRHCHTTWTGNEAQHCLGCHVTFVSIGVADKHRWYKGSTGKCLAVRKSRKWREKRANVWTNTPEGNPNG